MADDETTPEQARIAELEAEVAALTSGTTAQAGPGTPDFFYRVGGQGSYVRHPETGAFLLNPSNGELVVQEHPGVAVAAKVAAAEKGLAKAQDEVVAAQGRLNDARAEEAGVEARWAEIVAHLVAQDALVDDETRARARAATEGN